MKPSDLFRLPPILSGAGGGITRRLDDRARRTFRSDCLRQFFGGLTDTGPKTFFLLIAVQRYSAGDLFKTLISIPNSVAMTLSVLLLPLLSRLGVRNSVWLAVSRFISGACYLLAAWKPSLEPFAFWIFLGGLPVSIVYPLLTDIYHRNYPHRVRGQLFAWATIINMASTGLFSWLLALLLGAHSEHYRPVLILIGLSMFLAGWSFLSIPDKEHAGPDGRSFLHAFRWIRRDRTFAYMLVIWFIFGSAIFMITPLKLIYMTEPRYGLAYPAATIALIIGIIPEVFRFSTTAIWARLFDRYHFIGIRVALNVFLLASVIAFFFGKTKGWLCVAAALEGISSGGASIAWSLWVTHMAPVGHTTEYMSVNLFFTGIRGIVGTWLGIHLASLLGLQQVAWLSVGLVAMSIAMMLPLRNDRKWIRSEAGAGGEAGN
ncbi:MAG: MFS transporter [Fibrobacteria bacterium]